MRIHQAPPYTPDSQSGLSLIELMVAMAIGVVLLTGLIQIFSASSAAFGAAEGASRVQENARFAMDFMKRDLRMAGNLGYLNERAYIERTSIFNHAVVPSTNVAAAPFALRIDFPLQAYEFTGSAPGQAVDLTAGVTPAGGSGAYTPTLPTELNSLAGDAIAGSDIIVARFLGGELSADVQSLGGVGTLTLTDPSDAAFFEVGQMYGLSNRDKMSLFQIRGTGPTLNAGVGGLNASPWVGGEDYNSTAQRYEYVVYYVGLDAASGEPSLRQRRFDPNGISLLSGPQTLVEGVESMQLVFGADSIGARDDILDRYYTAGGINGLDADARLAWQRALNVRIGLLMRSARSGAAPRDAASPPYRAGDTVINVPVDGRVRQVYESVVTIRNRVRN